MVADCSNSHLSHIPSDLPVETEWLILANNSISVLHYKPYFQYLRKLDLQGNKIENLTNDFVYSLFNNSDIRYLNIAQNKLITLPRNMENLTLQSHVSIFGNPLKCSCDSVWMKHWVLNNSNIMGQVTCQMDSGRWIPVVQMDKADLGCDNFPVWGIVGKARFLPDKQLCPIIASSSIEEDKHHTDTNTTQFISKHLPGNIHLIKENITRKIISAPDMLELCFLKKILEMMRQLQRCWYWWQLVTLACCCFKLFQLLVSSSWLHCWWWYVSGWL